MNKYECNIKLSCVCADEASREKERLEEKQRAARKERAKDGEEWSTRLVLLTLSCFFYVCAIS